MFMVTSVYEDSPQAVVSCVRVSADIDGFLTEFSSLLQPAVVLCYHVAECCVDSCHFVFVSFLFQQHRNGLMQNLQTFTMRTVFNYRGKEIINPLWFREII